MLLHAEFLMLLPLAASTVWAWQRVTTNLSAITALAIGIYYICITVGLIELSKDVLCLRFSSTKKSWSLCSSSIFWCLPMLVTTCTVLICLESNVVKTTGSVGSQASEWEQNFPGHLCLWPFLGTQWKLWRASVSVSMGRTWSAVGFTTAGALLATAIRRYIMKEAGD